MTLDEFINLLPPNLTTGGEFAYDWPEGVERGYHLDIHLADCHGDDLYLRVTQLVDDHGEYIDGDLYFVLVDGDDEPYGCAEDEAKALQMVAQICPELSAAINPDNPTAA